MSSQSRSASSRSGAKQECAGRVKRKWRPATCTRRQQRWRTDRPEYVRACGCGLQLAAFLPGSVWRSELLGILKPQKPILPILSASSSDFCFAATYHQPVFFCLYYLVNLHLQSSILDELHLETRVFPLVQLLLTKSSCTPSVRALRLPQSTVVHLKNRCKSSIRLFVLNNVFAHSTVCCNMRSLLALVRSRALKSTHLHTLVLFSVCHLDIRYICRIGLLRARMHSTPSTKLH